MQGKRSVNTNAMEWVGYFCEHGHGTQANLAQARYWYEQAAVQGSTYAKEALKRLN